MIQIQKLNDIVNNRGGLIRTSDMLAANIKSHEIRKLVQDGVIERIRQGYYQLAEMKIVKKHS